MNKKRLKHLYQLPIINWFCKAGFILIEKIFRYPFLRRTFKRRTGYKLNLKQPKSFNEKITWKKVFDRNPLLPIVVDKLKVREYVRSAIQDSHKLRLIPLLYHTKNPNNIPFNKLPKEYVIKANHGSGTNIIVTQDKHITQNDIIHQCKKWLKTSYGFFKHEWAYQKVDRNIIIEKLLIDEYGKLPNDYKFHMAHGKCIMIQVNKGDFDDYANRTLTLYSPEWKKINVYWEFMPEKDESVKPKNLSKMLDIAQNLSAPFDYARIDLYTVFDSIYFGELTVYPTSGHAKVKPRSFDFQVGKHINVERYYWR